MKLTVTIPIAEQKNIRWDKKRSEWIIDLGRDGEVIISTQRGVRGSLDEAEFIVELIEACESADSGARNDILEAVAAIYEGSL